MVSIPKGQVPHLTNSDTFLLGTSSNVNSIKLTHGVTSHAKSRLDLAKPSPKRDSQMDIHGHVWTMLGHGSKRDSSSKHKAKTSNKATFECHNVTFEKEEPRLKCGFSPLTTLQTWLTKDSRKQTIQNVTHQDQGKLTFEAHKAKPHQVKTKL
ncbi:hypothetical protein PIB30_057072 [Stylosanthes scabra]|uniref:Uncharacterized protein n=1 Tax=Stylosanthes scabra TaxID=79078 RepID=A0ABU6RJN3_9FABA|nr:hypothetical protein [Stylosanthes scabra]